MCSMHRCASVCHPPVQTPIALPLPTLAAVWDRPDEFLPERFPMDGPTPNEQNTDYKYIPFR